MTCCYTGETSLVWCFCSAFLYTSGLGAVPYQAVELCSPWEMSTPEQDWRTARACCTRGLLCRAPSNSLRHPSFLIIVLHFLRFLPAFLMSFVFNRTFCCGHLRTYVMVPHFRHSSTEKMFFQGV